MAVGGAGDRSLEVTPTWAVAVVCAVFVIISVIIEHGIHSIGKWFQKRHKKAMSEALEKIKAELMLLGFISLLLTVGTKPVSKICIPKKAGDTMLPCRLKHYDNGGGSGNDKKKDDDANDGGRKLLSDLAQDLVWRRALAAAAGEGDYCAAKNKVSLISQSGVHQLHIFIFVLAVFHILYSVLTMALGQAKMKKWKSWELETSSLEYQYTNDPTRFRFTRQTSFVKRHSGLSTTPGIRWVVAFLRQFFGSITKVDYFTLRHGFINAHLAPNSKFNFHKYIKRSLEDDFKVVVGISIPLWTFAVVFLLLNVYQWYSLFWISFLPLIILLLVGMKLEIIIMEMALQIQERTAIVEGAPVVEPSNKLFWFNRPQWILFLIHFTLFQNAFQMAYFLWTVYSFGITSCFHENLSVILIPVVLGVVLQILCSYITLPLYALVTQMGSHMKTTIFEEQTAKALMNWRITAKHKKKYRKSGMDDGSTTILMHGESTSSTSRGSSPVHLLHNHKSNSTNIENVPIHSPISYNPETDFPVNEASTTPMSAHRESRDNNGHESKHNQYHDSNRGGETHHSSDFSFGNQRK